jgi:SAM-dependent methyltransferase
MYPSPHDRSIRPPHPLAIELAGRLRGVPYARVLDYCTGSGRNTRWLEREGFSVEIVSDDEASAFDRIDPHPSFDGIVASHGLLHGIATAMPGRVERLARRLRPGGWMCATFGATTDSRFGVGDRLDDATFAPRDGDEIGVAHAYFDEPALRTMLDAHFDIALLDRFDAAQTAGRWAHSQPLTGAVHWFFVGSVRERGR